MGNVPWLGPNSISGGGEGPSPVLSVALGDPSFRRFNHMQIHFYGSKHPQNIELNIDNFKCSNLSSSTYDESIREYAQCGGWTDFSACFLSRLEAHRVTLRLKQSPSFRWGWFFSMRKVSVNSNTIYYLNRIQSTPQLSEINVLMISILQTRKVKLREVKFSVQGHTASTFLIILLYSFCKKKKKLKLLSQGYRRAGSRAELTESLWFLVLSYNFHFVMQYFHHTSFSLSSPANLSQVSSIKHPRKEIRAAQPWVIGCWPAYDGFLLGQTLSPGQVGQAKVRRYKTWLPRQQGIKWNFYPP